MNNKENRLIYITGCWVLLSIIFYEIITHLACRMLFLNVTGKCRLQARCEYRSKCVLAVIDRWRILGCTLTLAHDEMGEALAPCKPRQGRQVSAMDEQTTIFSSDIEQSRINTFHKCKSIIESYFDTFNSCFTYKNNQMCMSCCQSDKPSVMQAFLSSDILTRHRRKTTGVTNNIKYVFALCHCGTINQCQHAHVCPCLLAI